MANRSVKHRRFNRIAAIALAAGMTIAGSVATALAQELAGTDDVVASVTDAIAETSASVNSSATHSWKKSQVTRSVEVNGVASAVVKPGDVLTFTLTYTDDNIWGSKSYIQRMTDVIPDGLSYVANSATYKVGDEDWVSPNDSDKWLNIVNNGAVEFAAGSLLNSWGSPTTSTVSFKWQYRVTDAIADGLLDTGTEIHFRPSNKVEQLHDMGPKLFVKRDAVTPGGSLGSFGSPGLSGLSSPGLQSPGAEVGAIRALLPQGK